MKIPTLDELLNFVQITPDLATSGQPERVSFPRIREAGYQLIIYLATSASANHIPDEGEIVHGLGMDFIHIPVIWEAPCPGQFLEFLTILDQYKGKRIFVHCALNYRASCFMFLYKVLFMAYDPETAWWDMLEVWEPDKVWKQFIRDVLSYHQVSPFPFL